jgi:hypothetical protein
MRGLVFGIFLAMLVAPSVVSAERESSAAICKKISEVGADLPKLFKDMGMFATIIRLKSEDASHREAAGDMVDRLIADVKDFNRGMNEIATMCGG